MISSRIAVPCSGACGAQGERRSTNERGSVRVFIQASRVSVRGEYLLERISVEEYYLLEYNLLEYRILL